PLRTTEDLVEQRQLQLTEALAAELGAEVGRPQSLTPHLFFQRVDDLAPSALERLVLLVAPDEVERLDLLADERVSPIQLLLKLGLRLEIPGHRASSPMRIRFS